MNKSSCIANFITVNEIASTFKSIHEDNLSDDIYKKMKKKSYEIYGIHDDSEKIIGYINIDDYKSKPYKIHDIKLSKILSSNTPLGKILNFFKTEDFMFVIDEDKTLKIATLADLEKPEAKMYIFILITSFESKITDIIREEYKESDIKDIIKPERMEKIYKIHEERKRNNIDIDLFDSLYLSDKRKLFVNADKVSKIGFPSNTKFDVFYKYFIRIRNAISHSTNYINQDNKIEIINCINKIEDIIINKTYVV